MFSLLLHASFLIHLCILLVLAAGSHIASLNFAVEDDPTNIDFRVSNKDIPGSDQCIMVPRRTGEKCNAFACYLDGGLCMLEPARGHCTQHIMRAGWSSPQASPFDKIGTGSCAPCRCKRRTELRPETYKGLKREGAAGGQGPGSKEDKCSMKSSDKCFATACFDSGGRCEFYGPSGRCLPHVLDSSGVLKRWSWTGIGGLPECAGGCHCQRTHAKKRKEAGASSSDAGKDKAKN